MTKNLLNTIYTNSGQSQGKLRLELQDKSSGDVRARKESELMATAMKSTTYMFPEVSPVRAGMIAQSMVLIFLHGDVVEPSPDDADQTITDEMIMSLWSETNGSEEQRPAKALEGSAKGVMEEDSITGRELLAGAFKWVKHTGGYKSIPANVFGSLRNCLDYRSEDIGRELLLAQLTFSCDVSLSGEERAPLDRLVRLYSDHVSLTNDLYSFDKEEHEHLTTGALLVNAIDVLRRVHTISTPTAKQVAQDLILDVEVQFYEEFKTLLESKQLNGRQEWWANGLVECLAGHISTPRHLADMEGGRPLLLLNRKRLTPCFPAGEDTLDFRRE